MTNRQDPKGGTYVMNHESFGRMMLEQRKLRVAIYKAAVRISEIARVNTKRSSERDRGHHDTHLADNYRVEVGPVVVIKGQGGVPGPRMSMRVVNRTPYAAALEFGSGGHAAGKGTRDLRRAGGQVGDIAGEPR